MAGEMRALTVWQPWATAIIWGGKDIENRPRMTRYRGRLWIHAGMHHPDWADYLEVRGLSGTVFGWIDTRRASAAELKKAQRWTEHTGALGVILGSVDVVGCHDDETAVQREPCSPWARYGQHHWMVANPRPLRQPVPCRGALGLWRLPDDVEEAVRKQIEEGACRLPERIQLRRTRGWRLPSGARSVARPGPYGRPRPPDAPLPGRCRARGDRSRLDTLRVHLAVSEGKSLLRRTGCG